jgi:uncharacterized protein (DUF1697 family)
MPEPGYAAFLRGVNLGPRRRVGSAALRALFEGMGFRDVDTFRASGNVVFGGGRGSSTRLAPRIERGLAESLGFEVAVFLRTAAEIRTIAAGEPFDRELVEASEGKLQVVLLPSRPSATARKEVLALATGADRLAFGARELYWLPSGGIRDSALNLRAIEQRLGATTMRTKGTIDELARKWFAAGAEVDQ